MAMVTTTPIWSSTKTWSASPTRPTAPNAPILFPFIVNTGGKRANEFDVIYVDPNNLSLVCANGNEAWSWGEATWWRFKNASDPDAALAGSGSRAWTYYPIDGSTWGNAGYIGDPGHGANLAAGVQWGLAETFVRMIRNGAAEHNVKHVILAGGVCANRWIRNHIVEKLAKRNIRVWMPDNRYSGDNASGCAAYARRQGEGQR